MLQRSADRFLTINASPEWWVQLLQPDKNKQGNNQDLPAPDATAAVNTGRSLERLSQCWGNEYYLKPRGGSL